MNKTTEQTLVNFQHLKTDGWRSSGQFQSAVAISELMYFFDIVPRPSKAPTHTHHRPPTVFSYFFTNNSRTRLPEVFYKKGVLKNFAKFARKHLCQGLFFNKGLSRLWCRCFPVNFVKFLRTPISIEHL